MTGPASPAPVAGRGDRAVILAVWESEGRARHGSAPLAHGTGSLALGALLPLLDMLPAGESVRVLAALHAAVIPIRP
jgi:hypothetical protein